MKTKKKKLIITMIAIILILFFNYQGKYQIGNILFQARMIDVNRDIIIQEKNTYAQDTGYASNTFKYFVDLSKEKIYKIEDFYIFGNSAHLLEKGSHYTLKSTKKLNDSEIDSIKNLTFIDENCSSEEFAKNTSIPLADRLSYYEIKYQGKTTTLSKKSAEVLENIINTMK